MAAGTTPIFPDTARSPRGRLTVANTNRDGSTGTYVTLFTAGTDGSRFDGFRWISEEAATAANAVRLFIEDANDAGNNELIYEGVVAATTFAAGTTPVPSGGFFPPEGIVLSGNTVVYSNVHATDTFGIHLTGGGDF